MKLSAKYLFMFLIILISSLSADSSLACGTVKGWVDTYFNEKYDNPDEALYMIQCEPLMRRKYKATSSEHEALAGMIEKGLKAREYCDRSLAVKNFFLFDQLYWLKGTKRYDALVAEIETRIKRSVQEISGELSLYEREAKEDYCARVGYEVKGMIWNAASNCITNKCSKIDVSHLEEKSKRISSFIHKTGKCFNDALKMPATDHIVQVNSDTLHIRKQPAPRDTVVTTLKRDDFLLVQSKKGDWLRVVDKSCSEGWVAGYLTRNARGK